MQELILWNNTAFANKLSSVFGNRNVITNNDDFEVVVGQLERYSSLIVLCELNWLANGATTNLQYLHGIEKIKELRRTQNLDLPVLFVSFLALDNIVTAADREIITAIGHEFYQLPALPVDLKIFIAKEFDDKGKIGRLSDMELEDIKAFYCSKEGILSHELHHLSAYLNYQITEENRETTHTELKCSMRKIYDLFSADSQMAVANFQTAFPKLTNENIGEAVKRIIREGKDLLKSYDDNANGNTSKEKSEKKFSWKVLLLDDEIDEHHELVQLMKANNINVICVNNASEATRILKKDWSSENSIMVVISDYRLYENTNGVKRHQKIQGYRFLKDIASTDHLVQLVAFSGLQRKFLLKSFRSYNIRTEVKSKTDYLSSKLTQQFFCDEIIKMAEENLEVIEAMPSKCAGFERSLKGAYKEFRMHPDYNKMEANISLSAKEYAWKIQQQIANGEEICIECIDNIRSPLPKTRKDPEVFLKRFQNCLVARRIALWLYVVNKNQIPLNIDSRKIAEILTGQKYPSDAYRQILSTNLGLSLDDFPKNITIEERRWLSYEMQLNIFRDITLINPLFDKISKIYKDFIVPDRELNENIKMGKYTLVYKYKQVNYDIDFANDMTPELKTATDVRVMFLLITERIKNDKKRLELIKPVISKLRLSLFESREKVIYLKKLFQYFNSINRILNKEKSVLYNPSAKIESKANFADNSRFSINHVYERVFELLLTEQVPAEHDNADVWDVFCIGEDIVKEMGKLTEQQKSKFFIELTKAINKENALLGRSFDETFGLKALSMDEEENGNEFAGLFDD